nr:hypothetical protein [Tanacetum cinerariifolium]
MGVRRQTPPARECSYPNFMKCQPLNFKGTEGVVKLTQWFEKMGTVFRISNCSVENQIKFFTCTLLGSALTWWNSHVMTVGHDVAYAMTWVDVKKKMTNKYCPMVKIKKLGFELWNLMFPEEFDKIEMYIGGLPDMVHGSMVASKPKTIQEVIEMAIELMDKKIRTFTERQTENKRKQDDNNNQAQQQPLKKKDVAIAYTARPVERKEYAGTLPLCNKCKFYHNGQCTKMAPKRTTKSSPATTTTIAASVTDAQLKTLVDQGVARALATRNADRSRNGEDSHDSGMDVRRQTPPARECTYPYIE